MKNKGYTVCPVYVEPLKYLEGEWYEKMFQTKIVWNGGGGIYYSLAYLILYYYYYY